MSGGAFDHFRVWHFICKRRNVIFQRFRGLSLVWLNQMSAQRHHRFIRSTCQSCHRTAGIPAAVSQMSCTSHLIPVKDDSNKSTELTNGRIITDLCIQKQNVNNSASPPHLDQSEWTWKSFRKWALPLKSWFQLFSTNQILSAHLIGGDSQNWLKPKI